MPFHQPVPRQPVKELSGTIQFDNNPESNGRCDERGLYRRHAALISRCRDPLMDNLPGLSCLTLRDNSDEHETECCMVFAGQL